MEEALEGTPYWRGIALGRSLGAPPGGLHLAPQATVTVRCRDVPMESSPTSRRDFLHRTGATLGGAWLSMHMPAIEAASLYAREAVLAGGQAFETLEAGEARTLAAVAARFFPTDDAPGANEAGVVYFMDRSLGSFFGWMRPDVRGALAALDAEVAREHPGGGGFSELDATQQDELMAWLGAEQGQSFLLLQILTACGMFGDPSQGGNRDGVGWTLIGFESAPAWDPPFGYYDRQYRETGDAGRRDAPRGASVDPKAERPGANGDTP